MLHLGPNKEHTILRASDEQSENESLTDTDEILQVFVAKRKQGYSAAAHKHKEKDLTSPWEQGINSQCCGDFLQIPQNETFVVLSGRILVKYYDKNKHYIDSIILYPGDVSLTRCGGYHAVEFLEESRLLEIKLGPYTSSEDDKEFMNE